MGRVALLVVVHDDARDVERLRAAYAAAGFEPGPFVGISFSIEAPEDLVERVFPDYAQHAGTDAELSLDRLSPAQREGVRAVVTQAPPDFGPGSF
jgi:hypothetical protein